MTRREVRDDSVGPGGLDGWTNQMHCKLRFWNYFSMEKMT
jgi:hypothetical protein